MAVFLFVSCDTIRTYPVPLRLVLLYYTILRYTILINTRTYTAASCCGEEERAVAEGMTGGAPTFVPTKGARASEHFEFDIRFCEVEEVTIDRGRAIHTVVTGLALRPRGERTKEQRCRDTKFFLLGDPTPAGSFRRQEPQGKIGIFLFPTEGGRRSSCGSGWMARRTVVTSEGHGATRGRAGWLAGRRDGMARQRSYPDCERGRGDGGGRALLPPLPPGFSTFLEAVLYSYNSAYRCGKEAFFVVVYG